MDGPLIIIGGNCYEINLKNLYYEHAVSFFPNFFFVNIFGEKRFSK